MKRHEMIRLQYRARRYMQHLLDQELEQRAKDIFLNQLVLTEENKIGLHPIKQDGEYWMTVFTHLLEEFTIRYGPYPAGFKRGFIKEARVPDPRLDAASKACNVVKRLKIEPNKYLFKYSKLQWLEETRKKGVIRISPAASYSDPSLHPAIQDDELRFIIQPNPLEFNLEVFDSKTGGSKGRMSPKQMQIIQESASNYYVYCLSSILVPRLFLDFDADACLIIRKPKEFISKLLTAFEMKNPGWVGVAKDVKYLDPLNSTPSQVDVFSCKHFRYSYQKEIRVIWLPSEPAKELEHQFIELGGLEDCSELICI